MGGRKVGDEYSRVWKDNIEKEDKLRLCWFRKNEKLLMEDAERPLKRVVTDKVKQEKLENYKQLFQDVHRQPIIKMSEPPPLEYDPECLIHPMRPVDHKTRQLLYTGNNKDGRLNYLHERCKIIPENKYYFPETTYFQYGWKMSDYVKDAENIGPRHGQSQIINQTFYRRGGIGKDPDWYQEPVRLSPIICDCR